MSDNLTHKTLTTIVYGLQALSFLVGISFVAAVIMNYMKRAEVEGTIYESHFKWQINTFWFGLLWGVIGFILTFVVIGFVVLFANAIWIIYRIIRGWLNLNENQPMYAS